MAHWPQSPFDLGSRMFPDHTVLSGGFIPWAAGRMRRHESCGFPSSTQGFMAPCQSPALVSIPLQDARSTFPTCPPPAAVHPKQWLCCRSWLAATLCSCWRQFKRVKNADVEIGVLTRTLHFGKVLGNHTSICMALLV